MELCEIPVFRPALVVFGLVCALAAACQDWQLTSYDGTRYSRTTSIPEIILQRSPNYTVLLTYELPRPQPSRLSPLIRYRLTPAANDLRGRTIRCIISVSNDFPVFASRGSTTWNVCPPIAARIFFTDRRTLYSNIESAQHPDNFWWSRAFVPLDSGGEFSITFSPENFSNGIGQSNSTFWLHAAQATDVGISFGTQCFFDTGAALTSGSGYLALSLNISN